MYHLLCLCMLVLIFPLSAYKYAVNNLQEFISWFIRYKSALSPSSGYRIYREASFGRDILTFLHFKKAYT